MLNSTGLKIASIMATVAILISGSKCALTNKGDGVTMKFVRIPAGEFMMGSPAGESGRGGNEGPQHKVKLTKPFYMSITEVTQQQYIQIMGHNPSRFKSADNPAENMSWGNAMEFCRRLSKKTGKKITLPTEAQWEYACRAGSDTRFCFGDDDVLLESYCWYKSNTIERSRPVATKRPNAWGLYDMHGNVMEWCSDLFSSNYYSKSPVVDPSGPSKMQVVSRVYRGGCCVYVSDYCRSATRDGRLPDSRSGAIGFRVVFAAESDSDKKVMDIVIAKEAEKIIIPEKKFSKLQPAVGFVITGAVQDATGTPVDGANIRILPNKNRELRLHPEGKFEINWQPRKSKENQSIHYLSVRHKERNLAAIVEINKDTDTIDVVLQRGGTLTGKVVDSAGKGIEKAVVTMRLKGPNGIEEYTGFSDRTDAEGKFDIRAIPLGHQYILITRSRGYGMTRTEIDSGNVSNNRIDAGSIVLVRGQLTVSGIVVDVNGKPVADIGVYCHGKGQPGSSTVTDANGKFKLDGIFKGRVTVMAGKYQLYGSVDVEAGANNIKVVLDNKGVPMPKGRACFPANTNVWVNGKVVQISKAFIGQVVGKSDYAFGHIERIEEHEDIFKCRDIVFENGNRISVVDSHCFMLDCGRWIAAQDLRNGLRLKTLNGTIGIKSVITRTMPLAGKVYNLKVKNSDRYPVGKDGVIVRDY
jgi:formylglycine-generating enzyme required for sulfatase activity/protocatechuate 3,4-dioxygenase beta subunit